MVYITITSLHINLYADKSYRIDVDPRAGFKWAYFCIHYIKAGKGGDGGARGRKRNEMKGNKGDENQSGLGPVPPLFLTDLRLCLYALNIVVGGLKTPTLPDHLSSAHGPAVSVFAIFSVWVIVPNCVV